MLKKIYSISYALFIIAVMLVALVIFASVVPIPGKLEIKIVQSGSMEPTIKTGSIVIIKPGDNYAVGDIITFGKDTKTEVPTTHRIVADKVESGVIYYVTKGDANEDQDKTLVSRKEVIGKVVFDAPYVGYIADFAKKPIGFILLIVLPALYIAYDEILKMMQEIKKLKNEKNKEKNKTIETTEESGS